MVNTSVSVVLPCYNEKENIISLIGFQQSDIENITMTKFMNKFNTEDKIKDFLILS